MTADEFKTSAVLEALRGRRTCRDYQDREVPRRVTDDMLDVARWAPNHRKTEPWRFFVLERGGATRSEVADLVARWTYENVKNPSPGRRDNSAESARREILDAPAFITDQKSLDYMKGIWAELERK